MPCKLFLRGDPEAIYCNDPADVVLHRIEAAPESRFIQIALTPYAHGDTPRTAYVSPGDVSAILPMHPLELEAELDDPPDWYRD
jgi:hypothetical protein